MVQQVIFTKTHPFSTRGSGYSIISKSFSTEVITAAFPFSDIISPIIEINYPNFLPAGWVSVEIRSTLEGYLGKAFELGYGVKCL
jgi:hypothetical protein